MFRQIIWNEETGGNIEHIEEHVLASPESESTSDASGLPCAFGYAPDGRYIIVVFEPVDDDTIYPVTAFEVPEPA